MKTLINLHQLTCAIALCCTLYGCGTTENKSQEALETLTVVPVVTKNITSYFSYNASVQGENEINIRPRVSGIITAVYVQEGDYVRAGQQLFQLDNRPFTQALHQAQATLSAMKAVLEKARIEKERITKLAQNNVVSPVQVAEANADLEQASANVQRATAGVSAATVELGYTLITAPVSGLLGSFPYKTGSFVDKDTLLPLTRLSATKNVYIYFSMSESDLDAFKASYPGNTLREQLKKVPGVELQLSDNQIYEHKGKLDMAAGQFDSGTGLITFRASFSNDENILHSGTTGKIRLPSILHNALIIPQKATFELQDKTFVFVLNKDNKVERRLVEIHQNIPNYYLISAGLKAGETIVLTGVGRLKDGTQIVTRQQSMDSLLLQLPLST